MQRWNQGIENVIFKTNSAEVKMNTHLGSYYLQAFLSTTVLAPILNTLTLTALRRIGILSLSARLSRPLEALCLRRARLSGALSLASASVVAVVAAVAAVAAAVAVAAVVVAVALSCLRHSGRDCHCCRAADRRTRTGAPACRMADTRPRWNFTPVITKNFIFFFLSY